jgi:NADH-quinone oxidoreductase subunit M
MLNAKTLVLAILIVPLIGALLAALCGRSRANAARWVSLITVVVNLALTAALVIPAVSTLSARASAPTDAESLSFAPEHVTRIDLLPLGTDDKPAAIQFYVGIDGLNLWLLALTAFLMVPSVLVSWTAITERVNEFFAWLLILETGMLGVFVSFDLILFYVFFELTLVPLFFLIGVWGGPLRRDAARKFFLFTLTGSLIALLGLIGIVLACKSQTGELTFAIPRLIELVQRQLRIDDAATRQYWHHVQLLVFLAMTAGFAVKVPLFPVHTWLPLAHVEAPTAGSVLLAGVLLKLGSYGFLRLAIPLCPDAALSIGVPPLGGLAAVGIIYGALCAFAQQDVKKMVAYSSVSHMGFCILGLFALNSAGINGGLLQMINHGLSTGGLFLLVGMLYERYHTRMIPDYGGMAARLKLLSFFMVFICLTSVGFPGLNGFIGEMLILAGTYRMQVPGVSSRLLVFVIACGIFLGGWYLFTMLKNVFFGPLHEPHHEGHAIADLNGRELAAIVPLGAACIALGLYPQPVLDSARRDVNTVVKIADAARDRAAMTKTQ